MGLGAAREGGSKNERQHGVVAGAVGSNVSGRQREQEAVGVGGSGSGRAAGAGGSGNRR